MNYENRSTGLSQNAKLGEGVATNYRPVGDSAIGMGTCPSTCAMLNNGCYANKGLVRMQADKSRRQFDSLSKLLEKGSQFVRLHTAGDFFKSDGEGGYMIDLAYWHDVLNIARINPHVTFWTYCHDVTKFIDLDFHYLNGTIPSNLHITASVDDNEARTEAKKFGFRTARVIDTPQDKFKGETLCPYDYQKHKNQKRTITCVECKLCFNPAHKNDIGFLKHK